MISTYKKLEPAEMLQGCALDLSIGYIDDINGTKMPANISDYACWLVLYPSGQEDYPYFRKRCSLVTGTTHKMSVLLLSEETKDWQGVYTLDFVLVDLNGELIQNARGRLDVHKANSDLIGLV